MPGIFICTAEIADNCMNLTVWGHKKEDTHHEWVCHICRSYQRKPLVRQIFLGKENRHDEEN